MSDLHTTRPWPTRLLGAALAVAAVAALTLAPRALVAPVRGAFLRLAESLDAPLHAWLPNASTDQVLNAMLFVPLGATIALLLPRRAWPLGILAGFALSAVVEYAQTGIPGRVPDADDVLWNTVGAGIGVVVVTLPRLAAAIGRGRQRGSVTRT